MPRGRSVRKGARPEGNGATLGFEQKLWRAADRMRGHMVIRKNLKGLGLD